MIDNKKEKLDFEKALKELNLENNNIDIVKCDKKMRCISCGSTLISWYLDRKANEVLFRCHNCKTSGYMSKEKYEKTINNILREAE